MTVLRIASLAAALVLIAPVDLLAQLVAQQKPLVAPGARVRVTAPTIVPNRVVGTVVALDTSRLLLQTNGRQARPRLEIPLASLTRLELFRGPGNRAAAFTLYGAGAGAVTGLILGYAAGEDCSGDEWFCFDREELALGGAVILGLAGAGIGLVAGLFTKSGRGHWTAVPLDHIRVSLTPYEGLGLSVSASVAF